MHDIKDIAANPEEYKRRLALRHDKNKPEDKIDEVLDLNVQRKIIIGELEFNLARLNVIGDDITLAKKANQNAAPFLTEAANIKAQVPKQKQALKEVEGKIQHILATLPNLPRLDVPEGHGEDDNVVLKVWNPPDAVDEIMEIIKNFANDDLNNDIQQLKDQIAEIENNLVQLLDNHD